MASSSSPTYRLADFVVPISHFLRDSHSIEIHLPVSEVATETISEARLGSVLVKMGNAETDISPLTMADRVALYLEQVGKAYRGIEELPSQLPKEAYLCDVRDMASQSAMKAHGAVIEVKDMELVDLLRMTTLLQAAQVSNAAGSRALYEPRNIPFGIARADAIFSDFTGMARAHLYQLFSPFLSEGGAYLGDIDE